MITLLIEESKPLNQKNYNNFITSLQLHQLKCTCGHAGCMRVHGYYKRYIRNPEGLTQLRICRTKCEVCGRTHALLPSSIVPYSQIPADEQASAIDQHSHGIPASKIIDSSDGILDESSFRYILLKYREHWQQVVNSYRIMLDNATERTTKCFAEVRLQFMQIRRTPNILFAKTT